MNRVLLELAFNVLPTALFENPELLLETLSAPDAGWRLRHTWRGLSERFQMSAPSEGLEVEPTLLAGGQRAYLVRYPRQEPPTIYFSLIYRDAQAIGRYFTLESDGLQERTLASEWMADGSRWNLGPGSRAHSAGFLSFVERVVAR